MALVVEIADAVVASLNGVTFSPTFTAVSKKTPRFKIPDLEELRVTVVPRSRDISMLTRGKSLVEYSIDVGIHKKVEDDDEVETLIGLTEQVTDHLYAKSMVGADWLGITNEPVYDPKMLREDSVFFSIVTARYQATR